MAGKTTGLEKGYTISKSNVNPETGSNEIPMYRLVVYGDNPHECKLPAAGDLDSAVFLGNTANDERLDDPIRAGGSQAGRNVGVMLDGIGAVRLAEDVTSAGTYLVMAEGGLAKPAPASGTFQAVGIAEDVGEEGQVIPFRIRPMTVTL